VIGGCGEGELDAGDGHAAFADRSGTSLDRSGANITRGKNTGQAGLERSWPVFIVFPSVVLSLISCMWFGWFGLCKQQSL